MRLRRALLAPLRLRPPSRPRRAPLFTSHCAGARPPVRRDLTPSTLAGARPLLRGSTPGRGRTARPRARGAAAESGPAGRRLSGAVPGASWPRWPPPQPAVRAAPLRGRAEGRSGLAAPRRVCGAPGPAVRLRPFRVGLPRGTVAEPAPGRRSCRPVPLPPRGRRRGSVPAPSSGAGGARAHPSLHVRSAGALARSAGPRDGAGCGPTPRWRARGLVSGGPETVGKSWAGARGDPWAAPSRCSRRSACGLSLPARTEPRPAGCRSDTRCSETALAGPGTLQRVPTLLERRPPPRPHPGDTRESGSLWRSQRRDGWSGIRGSKGSLRDSMVGRARPASWVRSGHGDAALPAFLVRWRPRACELRVPLRQGGCPGPAHLRAAFETGCEGVRNLKYTAPFKASCSAVVFPAGVGKRRQGRSAAGGRSCSCGQDP